MIPFCFNDHQMNACAAALAKFQESEAKREPDLQDPILRAFGAGFFDGVEWSFVSCVELVLARTSLSVVEVARVFDLTLAEVIKIKAEMNHSA